MQKEKTISLTLGVSVRCATIVKTACCKADTLGPRAAEYLYFKLTIGGYFGLANLWKDDDGSDFFV